MRPPEFTGGNTITGAHEVAQNIRASMRPPEFTGGNRHIDGATVPRATGFNEAAGIHRRKPQECPSCGYRSVPASMRPPEFTGGNLNGRQRSHKLFTLLQ